MQTCRILHHFQTKVEINISSLRKYRFLIIEHIQYIISYINIFIRRHYKLQTNWKYFVIHYFQQFWAARVPYSPHLSQNKKKGGKVVRSPFFNPSEGAVQQEEQQWCPGACNPTLMARQVTAWISLREDIQQLAKSKILMKTHLFPSNDESHDKVNVFYLKSYSSGWSHCSRVIRSLVLKS